MINNTILLNWMPPAMLTSAAPSLSVLKSYLKSNNYDVDVIYWNIKLAKLQCDFLWTDTPNFYGYESYSLLIFFNYLAFKQKNQSVYNHVKGRLISYKPQYQSQDKDIYDLHMKRYAEELDKLLDEILKEVVKTNALYYGMSVNFYQWVCGSIIAEKIKQINPQNLIVIGGIGSKNSAIAFLESFKQFDFALWGETEISLKILTEEISKQSSGIDFSRLINTAYKYDDKVLCSSTKKSMFVNLSSKECQFDISDYFEQKKAIDEIFKEKIAETIPIETSRGCHWKKM